jgi:hypothetical protein
MTTVAEAQENQQHEQEKKPFDITVIYNGLPKEIKVRHEETIKQVLDRAVAAFQPLPQPHTMSLFNEAGEELKNEALTVDQARVHEHDKLLLRPSSVKGG